jgi:hypothetical protein
MKPIATATLVAVTGGYYANNQFLQQQLFSLQQANLQAQTQPSASNQLAMGLALGTLMNRG